MITPIEFYRILLIVRQIKSLFFIYHSLSQKEYLKELALLS